MASMRNRGSYDKPFNTGSKHFFCNRKCHNYHDQRDLRLFELSFNSTDILQVQPGMLFKSLCEVVTEAILLKDTVAAFTQPLLYTANLVLCFLKLVLHTYKAVC